MILIRHVLPNAFSPTIVQASLGVGIAIILEASLSFISLGAVYRVLTQFESAGIVGRHNFDDGYCVYELASETRDDHMVGIDAHQVIEFIN